LFSAEPLDNVISSLVDSGIGMDFWNRIVPDFSDFFRYDTKLREHYKPQAITNSYDKPLIVINTVLQYLRLKSFALAFAFVIFVLEFLINKHYTNSQNIVVNDFIL